MSLYQERERIENFCTACGLELSLYPVKQYNAETGEEEIHVKTECPAYLSDNVMKHTSYVDKKIVSQ